MEYLIVCLTTFAASGLTFFSGFGLGTLLMPVFALFFPLSLAVALTAVVHFLNNIFKLVLIGRHINWQIVCYFGLPAIVAAFGGAYCLLWLEDLPELLRYQLFGREFIISPLKLIIGLLIAIFAVTELSAGNKGSAIKKKWLPAGGLLSGFFGGLSGHQGMFRSAFLIECGLSKEAFIASGAAISCFVDIARMTIYSTKFAQINLSEQLPLLAAATLAAFLGAFLGRQLLNKITLKSVRVLVFIMLTVIATALCSGII